MCCGSRRAAWRAYAPAATSSLRSAGPPPAAATRPQPAAGPAAPRGGFPTVPLRYHDAAEIQVRGPASGRAYRFSVAEPVQDVDARDAQVFMRNAAFQPA